MAQGVSELAGNAAGLGCAVSHTSSLDRSILSPVLISLLFIAAAVLVNHLAEWGRSIAFGRVDRLLMFTAAAVTVSSLLWKSRSALDHEVPRGYPWWPRGIGAALGLVVSLAGVLRSRRIRKG